MPTAANSRGPGRRGGPYDFARRVLATDWGKQLYLKRQGSVEPVFGQIKSNRGADRFQRRGRSAVRSEWRLLPATHNLLKLHRHHLPPPHPPPAPPRPPSESGARRGPRRTQPHRRAFFDLGTESCQVAPRETSRRP